MEYTSKQKQALSCLDGNVQIIACAGSGKTQVISQRIVNILKEKRSEGITPENIVAFTFTKKAAKELKNRIYRLCNQQMSTTQGLSLLFIGTIHAFCFNLLMNYVPKFMKYTLLTAVQQRLLIDQRLDALPNLYTKDKKQLSSNDKARIYPELFGVLREAEVNWDVLGDHTVLKGLRMYQKWMEERCYLDYTMQLSEAVKILETDPIVREKMTRKIRYLVVDEYQDVNPLQEKIISILHELGADICVVGDDDQTIFQWNGSDIDSILSFQDRYPNVIYVNMADNFRSSYGIVNTARKVAERNSNRLSKNMRSKNAQTYDPGDILAVGGFESPEEEANWIADKIEALQGVPFRENGQIHGLSYSDCAILLRSTKKNATPIVEALRAKGIEFSLKETNRFFYAPEIKAAKSIFEYLTRKIKADNLKKLWLDIYLGFESSDLDRGLEWLEIEKKDWRNRQYKSECSLQLTYQGFLEAISFSKRLAGYKGSPEHIENTFRNLGKFSQIITDYEQINFDLDLEYLYSGFVQFLRDKAPKYYSEGWEDPELIRQDAVQILTVHKAKGTEFPVVFVPCLLEGVFPVRERKEVHWVDVLPNGSIKGAERYRYNIEDERRLFYVTLTRSKKYLYCTWAPQKKDPERPGPVFDKPSRFIHEFKAGGFSRDHDVGISVPKYLESQEANNFVDIPTITFSDLKYFLQCPYRFKIKKIYGFNPGYNERLGYGKSIHNALAEAHRRIKDRESLSDGIIQSLLKTHLHFPYAYDERLRKDMQTKAEKMLSSYIKSHKDLKDVEYVEMDVEIKFADEIMVLGRLDLVRKIDTGETIIIDFKTSEDAQDEEISQDQLQLYALGYQQLTGKLADFMEIYNLDSGIEDRRMIRSDLLADLEKRVIEAGRNIRKGNMSFVNNCPKCNFKGICPNPNSVL
jgi:DNA helicase-2/ATP-dependent DNA helicase PcrA